MLWPTFKQTFLFLPKLHIFIIGILICFDGDGNGTSVQSLRGAKCSMVNYLSPFSKLICHFQNVVSGLTFSLHDRWHYFIYLRCPDIFHKGYYFCVCVFLKHLEFSPWETHIPCPLILMREKIGFWKIQFYTQKWSRWPSWDAWPCCASLLVRMMRCDLNESTCSWSLRIQWWNLNRSAEELSDGGNKWGRALPLPICLLLHVLSVHPVSL